MRIKLDVPGVNDEVQMLERVATGTVGIPRSQNKRKLMNGKYLCVTEQNHKKVDGAKVEKENEVLRILGKGQLSNVHDKRTRGGRHYTLGAASRIQRFRLCPYS